MIKFILLSLAYLLLAPLLGGLLAGFDRIVTARLQGRVGPPLRQPFYDVLKLLEKENLANNRFQNFYVLGFLVFVLVTGVIFFAGGDLLLTIFALTLAGLFLVLAAYAANSPYSILGAERELLQMMAYEPMLLLAALGLYAATHSFQVADILAYPRPLVLLLPGTFLGLLFILTIKLRKSPFDLSTSHHAHQELVKGLTTEFSGPALAMIEVAHWYENVILLGMVYLFFAWSPWLAVPAVLLVYLLEVFVDNTYARWKWQLVMRSSWIVAATLGTVNLLAVFYLNK